MHPKYFVRNAATNGNHKKRKYTKRPTLVLDSPQEHLNPIPHYVTDTETVKPSGLTFKALNVCPYCPEPLPKPAAGAPVFSRCPYCATALPKTTEVASESKVAARQSLVTA
jgi:uncharacterized protein with PIN domain